MGHHGRRSPGNWRYRVMKHYLHRAQKFKMNAETLAELKAWDKVEEWFNSILRNKKLKHPGNSILPEQSTEKSMLHK